MENFTPLFLTAHYSTLPSVFGPDQRSRETIFITQIYSQQNRNKQRKGSKIMDKNSLKLVAGMILVGSVSQLLPHPSNFSPMAAIAMFGGAKLFDKRMAFFATLASLL